MNKFYDVFKRYRLGPLLGLVILIVFLSIESERFLTITNLRNVALQTSVNTLLAIGMTFVILTSGIDLSVGSVLALSAAIAGQMMASSINPWIACLVGLLVGAASGVINGLFVAYGRLAPFIVTLGTMTLYRGITQVFTQGMPIANLPSSYQQLGSGSALGIPIPVIITFCVFVIGFVLLQKTIFGRKIYALGGNEKVAYLAGIPVKRYLLWVYAISGVLAALAGLINTARLGTADPNAGVGYELDAISAVVLGGTSLFGGEGKILGTLIGALILGVINNGLNLLNVDSFYQGVVKGIIILIAVMLDRKKTNN